MGMLHDVACLPVPGAGGLRTASGEQALQGCRVPASTAQHSEPGDAQKVPEEQSAALV